MQGRLLAVAAIFLFFFVGVGMLQHGYWDATVESEPHVEFNDSITVTKGTVHQLASSEKSGVAYAPERDINVTQAGSVIEREGNWSWIRPNGTIRVKSGSTLSNGDVANVTGYYARPAAVQNTTKDIGLVPVRVIGRQWQFLAGLILLFGAAGVLAGRA